MIAEEILSWHWSTEGKTVLKLQVLLTRYVTIYQKQLSSKMLNRNRH